MTALVRDLLTMFGFRRVAVSEEAFICLVMMNNDEIRQQLNGNETVYNLKRISYAFV